MVLARLNAKAFAIFAAVVGQLTYSDNVKRQLHSWWLSFLQFVLLICATGFVLWVTITDKAYLTCVQATGVLTLQNPERAILADSCTSAWPVNWIQEGCLTSQLAVARDAMVRELVNGDDGYEAHMAGVFADNGLLDSATTYTNADFDRAFTLFLMWADSAASREALVQQIFAGAPETGAAFNAWREHTAATFPVVQFLLERSANQTGTPLQERVACNYESRHLLGPLPVPNYSYKCFHHNRLLEAAPDLTQLANSGARDLAFKKPRDIVKTYSNARNVAAPDFNVWGTRSNNFTWNLTSTETVADELHYTHRLRAHRAVGDRVWDESGYKVDPAFVGSDCNVNADISAATRKRAPNALELLTYVNETSQIRFLDWGFRPLPFPELPILIFQTEETVYVDLESLLLPVRLDVTSEWHQDRRSSESFWNRRWHKPTAGGGVRDLTVVLVDSQGDTVDLCPASAAMACERSADHDRACEWRRQSDVQIPVRALLRAASTPGSPITSLDQTVDEVFGADTAAGLGMPPDATLQQAGLMLVVDVLIDNNWRTQPQQLPSDLSARLSVVAMPQAALAEAESSRVAAFGGGEQQQSGGFDATKTPLRTWTRHHGLSIQASVGGSVCAFDLFEFLVSLTVLGGVATGVALVMAAVLQVTAYFNRTGRVARFLNSLTLR